MIHQEFGRAKTERNRESNSPGRRFAPFPDESYKSNDQCAGSHTRLHRLEWAPHKHLTSTRDHKRHESERYEHVSYGVYASVEGRFAIKRLHLRQLLLDTYAKQLVHHR